MFHSRKQCLQGQCLQGELKNDANLQCLLSLVEFFSQHGPPRLAVVQRLLKPSHLHVSRDADEPRSVRAALRGDGDVEWDRGARCSRRRAAGLQDWRRSSLTPICRQSPLVAQAVQSTVEKDKCSAGWVENRKNLTDGCLFSFSQIARICYSVSFQDN